MFFLKKIDESQFIKNHHTKHFRAIYQLKTRRRFCLSGTPIQNTLYDLYSLLSFLRVENMENATWFRDYIFNPVRNERPEGYAYLQVITINFFF